MSLEHTSTAELRNAARAWRANDLRAATYWGASGWFKWITPESNLSLYDRIEEMINEIERLRAQ